MGVGLALACLSCAAMAGQAGSAAEWVSALRAAGAQVESLTGRERNAAAQEQWIQVERRFPLASDWMLQDAPEAPLWAHVPAGGRDGWRQQSDLLGDTLADLLVGMDSERWYRMTERVLAEAGSGGRELVRELFAVGQRADAATLALLYLRACEVRRAQRLAPLLEQPWDGILFTRHFNMGGSHYAYTEALTDAQGERQFRPGASLCLLRMDGTRGVVETLLTSAEGVIRDVDVSWDGKTILFAWKKSDRGDDYSLYTMDAATRTITPITDALGHADYEGVFLPDGDIVFNSTRCVQTVDCFWTEVSNLYRCGPDGRFLRRLSFDQVHTNYPTVTADGRVLYTRWDYNDRGQLFPQGLFQMFPDGTAQSEYYGNTSWFPTTILHARDIPGSHKVLAVFTGHHSFQAGKLGVLDTSLGRQENQGAQLAAPIRETPAERIDAYGQEGDLFMYPWPIDAQHFLVSYAPRGWEGGGDDRYRTVFGLYFMDMDGRRELLDSDTEQGVSAGRMVPLAARRQPHLRPDRVDYTKDTGVYYLQDVYEGPGLEGVQRGTIKRLRVVALEYRAAGIGQLFSRGEGGAGHPSTPIAVGNGSWDVKVVLGNTDVYADGSAMFEVPARTPVYFQALDDKGQAVQTMRTWSTLQPGEFSSCVGCHSEAKHLAPVLDKPTRAMQAGPRPLTPFYGPARGFSFVKEIQPILDRNCIACHDDRSIVQRSTDGSPARWLSQARDGVVRAFSLLGTRNRDPHAKRMWSDSYLNLTRSDRDPDRPVMPLEAMLDLPWGGRNGYEQLSNRIFRPHPLVNWVSSQSVPTMLAPYHSGAATSRLMRMLEEGHHDVTLTREEMEKLACWIDLAVPYCGDYTEAHAWSASEVGKYEHFLEKRRAMEAIERDHIQALIDSRQGL